MNVSDEIKRLHELHLAGALTDAEFERAKANALGGAVNLDKTSDRPSTGGDDLVAELGALRRSRSDRWLGGVCGGIGKASGIESWIWRLMFVLCTVFIGFGLLVYLLMWIFVPEE
ncbi:PspC domain-containing protein [Massilia sp. TWR1-2-2]|uniref:PspC domain-containing protein n=1 Tax=Massilia sp. TWR1-2-2 TaxID=2804584 RepID=UPI003CF45DF1